MKKMILNFLLGLAIASNALSIAVAEESEVQKRIDYWWLGTEFEKIFKSETEFIFKTMIELVGLGRGGDVQYTMNPEHSVIVFWQLHPSSGSCTYSFWIYKKVNSQFKFYKEYIQQERYWEFQDDIQNFIFQKDGFIMETVPTKEGAVFRRKFEY